MKAICQHFDMPLYSSHGFRIGFITCFLRDNMPIHKVSKMIGHKKLENTERYYRFIFDEKDKQLFNDIFEKNDKK